MRIKSARKFPFYVQAYSLLHGGQHALLKALDRFAGVVKCIPILLHGSQHDLFIVLEIIAGAYRSACQFCCAAASTAFVSPFLERLADVLNCVNASIFDVIVNLYCSLTLSEFRG